jgi:hypothetical protein
MDLCSQVDSQIRSDLLAKRIIDHLQHCIYKFHPKYTTLSAHRTVLLSLPFRPDQDRTEM